MMGDLFELKREFLEYCELDKGQSNLTISNYDRYLSKFLEWLKNYRSEDSGLRASETEESDLNPKNLKPKTQVLLPSAITQESVREYRLHVNRLSDRTGRELKKTTQNYHILALRAFLRYLAGRGISSLSPEKVSVAKTGDREITFLESEEVSSLLSAPDENFESGVRDMAILEILFSTGMRVSELNRLNIGDINFERGEIAVLGKGKKLRVVFLSEKSIETIKKYLDERGYIQTKKSEEEPLFLSKKGSRLSVRSIERIVKKYSLKAGLAKKVSPHTLRHSFATDLLISGADVRSVQSLLGHSSITTTQVYTHVTDQHLREIHQKFHGRSLEKSEIRNPKSETNSNDQKNNV